VSAALDRLGVWASEMADHPDTPQDERALWVQIAGEVAAYVTRETVAPPQSETLRLDDDWMAGQW
jgi:hypothetical protein